MAEVAEFGGRTKSVVALLSQRRGPGSHPRLSKPDRQRCVDQLLADGVTAPQMAELLGVCEKTISRDRRELRELHALEIDKGLGKRLAGELLHQAEISISNLRRLGRDQHAGVSERVLTSVKAFEIMERLIARLQSMGYVETTNTIQEDALPREHLVLQAIQVASVIQTECADDTPLIHDISRLMATFGPSDAIEEQPGP